MPAPAIDLLLRKDYLSKGGGDLVLARQYETALSAAGWPARLDPLSRTALSRGNGTVHLFNVDRYFEFAHALQAVASRGRPYVVSPIHHPTERVEYFESSVRTGALGIIASLGRGPFGRERIKHSIRGHSARAIAEAMLVDAKGSISRGLTDSALIVAQAPSEVAELERTFGVKIGAKSAWVPNGVSFDEDADVSGIRDIDVLVVGRIEERKNQLKIARDLGETPWKVTFVGADNVRNASYVKQFHKLVGEYENLRVLPHMSLRELRNLYTRSKVSLSASYFEVVSLAELEAAAHGCQVVSATSGYLRDYMGDLATYIDPMAQPDILRDRVASALRPTFDSESMSHVRSRYSWANAHARLVEAYENAGLLHA